MKLSVIIPYCNEYSQIVFTLRGVHESIDANEIEHEVIAIDNWTTEVERQDRTPDLGHTHKGYILYAPPVDVNGDSLFAEDADLFPVPVRRGAPSPDKGHKRIVKKNDGQEVEEKGQPESFSGKRNPWLKYVRYDKKLSHWCAKHAGVEASSGELLLFVDAHVVPSHRAIERLVQAYEFIRDENGGDDNFTCHLPLTYHILESHELIYSVVFEGDPRNKEHTLTYTFCGVPQAKEPFEVPCMSTCGMIMSRALYDRLGGWPRELGIYGGGEHWMNFAGAVCGVRKFIVPGIRLHHHGEKRGYNWNYDDNLRNRGIAAYLYGGEEKIDQYMQYKSGRDEVKKRIRDDVVEKCAEHRALIEKLQTCTIDEWSAKWKERLTAARVA